MNYLLKILENVKNGATTPELAEKQVLNLLGINNHFNEQQLNKVAKMLKDCAFDAWSDANTTTLSFEEWWFERNKVNLNDC